MEADPYEVLSIGAALLEVAQEEGLIKPQATQASQGTDVVERSGAMEEALQEAQATQGTEAAERSDAVGKALAEAHAMQARPGSDAVERSGAVEEALAEAQATEVLRDTDGAEPSGAFTWGASLVPAKKVIVEDDSEEVPSDFWNWLRNVWSSRPKSYGLREEGWSPAMGSIVEEESDCETDISTAASEGDLVRFSSFSSLSSLKALETGLLAHHHRICQDCQCKFCSSP